MRDPEVPLRPGDRLLIERAAREPYGRLDLPLNLQFTSRSTGRPKAVVLSQRALWCTSHRFEARTSLDLAARHAGTVVLPGPDGALDADALSAFCAARLARYKRLGRFILCDGLPALPSGKIDRAAVRRAVAAGEWRRTMRRARRTGGTG
jgi:acyl-CoA synthetase (AMP-forming)/AMP-acid ligase II